MFEKPAYGNHQVQRPNSARLRKAVGEDMLWFHIGGIYPGNPAASG